ncbi:MBL fold metallo-hydrolase [Halosimplex pelagicum]|uniref:MBL fold metallo-hydrolase n=1 Tax=Halosimplex pelagicum TaxID=869886 RepID=A0A7D5TW22_9EURY|nr:MBL fold metallo-hydrolase [Halosimplex pelagicum]QLH83674.1 MBL fold metallo-hydrolase [Halosimplex pelagicum]
MAGQDSDHATEVASDVYLLSEFPRRYLNAYVVGDVLVDAGTRWWGRRLVRRLRAHDIEKHVLTHAHPDHQGMTAAVCEEIDIPVLCHEDERAVVESGETSPPMPQNRTNELFERFMAGDGHPVAEAVEAGDSVGEFEVVETPGNAPGHISLWREADGTVLLGDVLSNIHLFSLRYGLHELPSRFTHSPTRSIESARKIADLEPDLVCFGHGPPLTDGTRFQDFVADLGQSRR